MITKIKLYLAFLLFYAKQIRMRGLCDSLVLMYHVFFLVFFNNVDKHHCVKPQIRNYAPNMIQKRKESASLVKRGHSASNVTIKTYKCPLPHHAT